MNIRFDSLVSTALSVALLAVVSVPTARAQDAAATATQSGAQLSVTGPAGAQVTLDGVSAATGATVFSGSRIVTPAGVTGTVVVNGSRVTLNESTDAVVSFNPALLRLDVICGSATGAAAPGQTVEIFTQADANVHATAPGVRVTAEGRDITLDNDQQISYAGASRVIMAGGSSADFATVNCDCMCAQPPVFPPAVVAASPGFPLWAILAIIGGTAGVIVPIVIDDDDDDEVVSQSQF
jgi:uncharacterized protein with beta-barrel porin domain